VFRDALVNVELSAQVCSIVLLFGMIVAILGTIWLFDWKLNMGMAIVMFLLYFVFIAISILLEKDIIKCSAIFGFF